VRELAVGRTWGALPDARRLGAQAERAMLSLVFRVRHVRNVLTNSRAPLATYEMLMICLGHLVGVPGPNQFHSVQAERSRRDFSQLLQRNDVLSTFHMLLPALRHPEDFIL